MKNLKIGHYTHTEHATGLTVFLFEKPATAAFHLCGSSPATRELHTLELDANTTHIDALLFTGGSAYGLGATDGVMRFLQEQGRGKPVPHGVVPIVPTVALYDLALKAPEAPVAEKAYEACRLASKTIFQGRIGVGTGATVGKLVPNTQRMSGGLGFAEIMLENGLKIMVYAAVNCVGDVRDETGKIIAGGRYPDGQYADACQYFLTGESEKQATDSHTTLVAIFTNAKFSKVELKRIAKMAVSGMGRAIFPVFTRYDGDIVFAVSLGENVASEVAVGTMAAEVVRQAIVNAVAGSVVL